MWAGAWSLLTPLARLSPELQAALPPSGPSPVASGDEAALGPTLRLQGTVKNATFRLRGVRVGISRVCAPPLSPLLLEFRGNLAGDTIC